MIRYDIEDILEDEFENVITPFNEHISDYIKTNIINEFIAYDLASAYRMNALWNCSYDIQINTACEDLAGSINRDMLDKKEITKLLEEKYKLKVISESPFDIKDLQD